MKKKFLLTAVVFLSVSAVSPSIVLANSSFDKMDTSIKKSNGSDLKLLNLNSDNLSSELKYYSYDIQHSVTGTIVVFVGGLLAGYIIDGIIVYATGQPAANWVATGIKNALNYAKRNPVGSTMHVSKSGVVHGGGGGGF